MSSSSWKLGMTLLVAALLLMAGVLYQANNARGFLELPQPVQATDFDAPSFEERLSRQPSERNAKPSAAETPPRKLPKLSIHCFAFDRPENFQRLWSSLSRAKPTVLDITFTIHVDYDDSNSESWRAQVDMATTLSGTRTRHGPVTTIFATANRGLRATMLEAWAPVEGEYAMFLEDDIEVSELILVYAERFILTYGEAARRDPKVLGYKLYNQKWDEVNQRLERPVMNSFKPFKIQEPCSWGSVFVAKPYSQYLRWFVKHVKDDPYIPQAWSNTWDASRSAKKYLQRFMWEQSMTLIAVNLPEHLSLSTPRIDGEGTNIKARWLEYLKERLEVPLLTTNDVNRLQNKGYDPLQLSTDTQMVILNATHDEVESLSPPDPDIMQLLDMDELPSKRLLDPKHYKGARFRIIEKGKSLVLAKLRDPGFPQPKHRDLTPSEGAALAELLTTASEKGGGGLGMDFVTGIADRGVLFTLAKMLIDSYQHSLILDAQYGLTNRLRAYGSARAIAQANARFLVVLWDLDSHCQADIRDLFLLPSDVYVLTKGEPIRDLLRKTYLAGHFAEYDLMVPEQKNSIIDGRIDKHLYIRSAFQIVSREGYGAANIVHLRELGYRPAAKVEDILSDYYDNLPKQGHLNPHQVHADMVGVHVRMVAHVSQDTPGLTKDEALRMELATAFRVSCHVRYFQKMMLTFPTTTRFFLSADSPEAYQTLLRHPQLSGRVYYIDSHKCTERTAECMVYAAADLILLSRTTKLLTSRWSAFSETAAKMSGRESVDACDEPEGGWQVGQPEALAQQIVSYLSEHNIPHVDRVQEALQKFVK
eukprot:TRINITY_DN8643_c0_g1_i5.p1 TRINITY_DN8643_c0_g1~~TRINITY_DN8643_c0_g1_i5.p1  ORF type:complete len:818 (+),score=165.31 TRINITY_DN8643_c0_g1_i5:29-2482(+)